MGELTEPVAVVLGRHASGLGQQVVIQSHAQLLHAQCCRRVRIERVRDGMVQRCLVQAQRCMKQVVGKGLDQVRVALGEQRVDLPVERDNA